MKTIIAKINNKIKKLKAYKTACFGAYEFAWIKLDGEKLKLRRRMGGKYFFYFETLKQDNFVGHDIEKYGNDFYAMPD